MKYHVMTEEQVKWIDEQCANGNGETLFAFGQECVDFTEVFVGLMPRTY